MPCGSRGQGRTRGFGGWALSAPAPSAAPEGLWTWREVAAYLQMSKAWVYEKSAAGVLPTLHLGSPGSVRRRLRFEPQAIRAFARNEMSGAKVIPIGGRTI